MLINCHDKTITLFDDKVERQFNSPIASPDDSRGFCIASYSTNMPYVRQNKQELQSKPFDVMVEI